MYSKLKTSGWVQQEPAGYVDGASLYQFVYSAPTNFGDPSGLQTKPTTATSQPTGGGFDVAAEDIERARAMPAGIGDPARLHPDPPGPKGDLNRANRRWDELEIQRKAAAEREEKAKNDHDETVQQKAEDEYDKIRREQIKTEKEIARLMAELAKDMMDSLSRPSPAPATAPATGPTTKPSGR